MSAGSRCCPGRSPILRMSWRVGSVTRLTDISAGEHTSRNFTGVRMAYVEQAWWKIWLRSIGRSETRSSVRPTGSTSGRIPGAHGQLLSDGVASRAGTARETAPMANDKASIEDGSRYVRPVLDRVERPDGDRRLIFFVDATGEIQRIDIVMPSGLILEIDPIQSDISEYRRVLERGA